MGGMDWCPSVGRGSVGKTVWAPYTVHVVYFLETGLGLKYSIIGKI